MGGQNSLKNKLWFAIPVTSPAIVLDTSAKIFLCEGYFEKKLGNLISVGVFVFGSWTSIHI